MMETEILTKKDIEKLEMIRKSVIDGNACTFDKNRVLDHLNSIIEPKCAVCRGKIESDMVVINKKKVHDGCKKRYMRR